MGVSGPSSKDVSVVVAKDVTYVAVEGDVAAMLCTIW